MTVEMPDHFRGKPIPDDAIEIALAAEKKDGNEGFIYVRSVELYFAKERSHLGKDWHDTHRELHKQNLSMPTIPQFIEFLKYLRADPTDENTSIYDKITGKRDPWRGEWLDAKFYAKGDEVWVAYNHIVNSNGKLVAQHEKLEGHLMQDKRPGVSLEHWLNNPTKQGLPQENSKRGELGYWHPKGYKVTRFTAGSAGAYLNCNGVPSGFSSDLGVFACTEKLGGKQ